jgi:hypothetical protein
LTAFGAKIRSISKLKNLENSRSFLHWPPILNRFDRSVFDDLTFGLLMLLSSGVAILSGRVVLPAFLLALISLPFIQGI